MTIKILYCCEVCVDSHNEGCGYDDPDMLRVLPKGMWICEDCFDLELDDDIGENVQWRDLDSPPEYSPVNNENCLVCNQNSIFENNGGSMSKTTPPIISYEEAKRREKEFEELKLDYEPSKECLDHMDKIAKEQQSARANTNFVFGNEKHPFSSWRVNSPVDTTEQERVPFQHVNNCRSDSHD